MTNDEKKREDSPEDRTPWYGKPMDDAKPPEEEKVEITEDDVGVIEVDDKGEVRIPGQDPPFAPDEGEDTPRPTEDDVVHEHPVEQKPIDPLTAVDPVERIHVVRVIEMTGTAEAVKQMLDKSFLRVAGEGITTGTLTIVEKERHYLKEGDYIVTIIKNVARDG